MSYLSLESLRISMPIEWTSGLNYTDNLLLWPMVRTYGPEPKFTISPIGVFGRGFKGFSVVDGPTVLNVTQTGGEDFIDHDQ